MTALSLALAGATALTLAVVFAAPAWLRRWAGRGIFLDPPTVTDQAIAVGVPTVIGFLAGLWWGSPVAAVPAAAAVWLLVFAARADLVTMRIPREPCWTVFAVGLIPALLLSGTFGLIWFVLAFLLIGFATGLTALITRGGLGSGDMRLLLAITPVAAWVGVLPLLFGILLAALLQLVLRLARALPRYGRAYPFAPALAVGLIAAITARVTGLERLPVWF